MADTVPVPLCGLAFRTEHQAWSSDFPMVLEFGLAVVWFALQQQSVLFATS
ncbi:MAG: hypothetical protein N3B01_07380 [Verrucomicrobiae bacterium]|nr:hypothetical protein [Verrucomicrobiae bacterium]